MFAKLQLLSLASVNTPNDRHPVTRQLGSIIHVETVLGRYTLNALVPERQQALVWEQFAK